MSEMTPPAASPSTHSPLKKWLERKERILAQEQDLSHIL